MVPADLTKSNDFFPEQGLQWDVIWEGDQFSELIAVGLNHEVV